MSNVWEPALPEIRKMAEVIAEPIPMARDGKRIIESASLGRRYPRQPCATPPIVDRGGWMHPPPFRIRSTNRRPDRRAWKRW